eukprot:6184339-Pleurochrysis_carterae.AAC.5
MHVQSTHARYRALCARIRTTLKSVWETPVRCTALAVALRVAARVYSSHVENVCRREAPTRVAPAPRLSSELPCWCYPMSEGAKYIITQLPRYYVRAMYVVALSTPSRRVRVATETSPLLGG